VRRAEPQNSSKSSYGFGDWEHLAAQRCSEQGRLLVQWIQINKRTIFRSQTFPPGRSFFLQQKNRHWGDLYYF